MRSIPTRRAVVLASVAATTALLLAACSGSPSAPTSSAKHEDVTLTFMNQSRGQEAALNALAEKYTKETGVKIVVDTPGPTDYLAKLQADAQSKNMPDMYSAFDATSMAPFYKAGWAMDLSKELKGSWKNDFSANIIKMATFEKGNTLGVPAGIYTVHWETQTYGFLADTKALGYTPEKLPKTTKQFISDLAAKGGNNFSVAASVAPKLIQTYASNWLTDKQIAATFEGKASWKSDGWRNALQLLVDMKKAGVIANGALPGGGDDNPTVESSFFSKHDVAAIFDATAGIAVAKATTPDYNDFVSMAVPAAANGKLKPRAAGVPGKGAIINPRGKHPKEALAFVKWLTAPAQQKFFADEARILPADPDVLAKGKVAPQLAGFASSLDQIQVLSVTPTVNVNNAMIRDVQSLVLGEMTVSQVLDDLQATQQRG